LDTTHFIETTGMRAQKRFSGVAFTEATVLRTENTRTSTLKRGLVQPQAVTSNRNEVSRNRLVKDGSLVVLRTATPPPQCIRLPS
jgi:hypothetical protein